MIRNLHSSSNQEVSPEEKAVRATLIAMSKMLKLEHRDEHLYQTPLRIYSNFGFVTIYPEYLEVLTKFIYDIEPGKTHIICDEYNGNFVDSAGNPVYNVRPYIVDTNTPFSVIAYQHSTNLSGMDVVNENRNLAFIPVYSGMKINSNSIGLPITDPQLFKNQSLRIGFTDTTGTIKAYPANGYISLIVYRYTG